MKAVVFEKRGGPGKLALREVDKPTPKPGEVLVKVCAASVNAGDCRAIRLGMIPKRKIFGADIAGVVEAVGTDVRQFQPCDEVAADLSACGLGGFAEYAAAPWDAFSPKPSNLSFEQAAALPVAAVATLQALRIGGAVRPGQKVLVLGAGGGVGTFAVQLAKYFGAEVTALCGPANVERMRAYGADFTIDYTREDFRTSGKRYDRILVVNGSRALGVYRRALNPQGIAVVVGGPLRGILLSLLLGPVLSLGGKKIRVLVAKPNTRDLSFVLRLASEGAVVPVIGRTYPLEETAAAVRHLSEGHSVGKTIIQIGS